MDLEQLFYTLGALFALAAIVYFAWEYLEVLPRITKSFLLFGLAVLLFLAADVLRQREAATKTAKRVRA